MLAVVVLIAVTLAGGAAWLRSDMRAGQWAEAGRAAENLALGLERDVNRVIEGYDKSLQHAARAYALPGFDALPPSVQYGLLFDSVALAIPNGMAVMDRDGKPVFSSNHRQYGTLEFGDRDWFRVHRDAPEGVGGGTGLFVSAPLIGKLTGDQNIPFSRRIVGPDGSFQGVVVTTIQASFVQNLFDALRLGPQSTLLLTTLEGRLIARTPYSPSDFGRDVAGSQVFSLLSKAPAGLYEGPSITDGIHRLSAYRRLGSAPFVVVVGLAEGDIYAPWYQTARVVGAVLVLVLVLAAGLGWILWRELRRRATAERTTQAMAGRLEALIETVPAAVWSTSDADAATVAGNRYAAELLRLPYGSNPSLTAPAAVRPQHFRVLLDGVEIPPADLPIQRAARGEDVPLQEYEVAFEDGTTSTILIRAMPLRDPSGALAGSVCAAIDVTERKQAEAALRRSEEEFHALAENLPNLCWMANADGWIYWYNRGWYDYTGTTPADMEGWGWQSVHDPAVLSAVMGRWKGCIAAGMPFEMTFPLRGSDGAFRPFLTRIVPLRDAGGAIIRWFGSNVDISEQQQTEAALRASEDALRRLNEQLEARVAAEVTAREQAQARLAQSQRLEALGQLAGGIAHDFNNVLQAVSGGLGLIVRRAEDPVAVRDLARMADAAAKRGASITGRLLTFARRGELQAAPVPPAALLDGLREMLAPTLGASIQVVTHVDPDAPPLLTDRAQLETVLVNLAVNARDAMPDGGILRITATVEAVAGPGGSTSPAELGPGAYLRLDLTDVGTGMDAATLARASEPFFTTKPPGQGTGLGLAMARGFAEQSKGGFALRSAPGEGTTVTLWFPVAGRAVQSDALDEPAPPPATASDRVLLVDDDAMVRAVLAGHLEARGYRVSQASDGLDALARLDAGEAADLLVTDFAMPGMNGLALIAEARRRRPGLPALLLTGYAEATVQLHVETASPEALMLLRKPVSGDELTARASALLNAPAKAAE